MAACKGIDVTSDKVLRKYTEVNRHYCAYQLSSPLATGQHVHCAILDCVAGLLELSQWHFDDQSQDFILHECGPLKPLLPD